MAYSHYLAHAFKFLTSVPFASLILDRGRNITFLNFSQSVNEHRNNKVAKFRFSAGLAHKMCISFFVIILVYMDFTFLRFLFAEC